MDFRMKEMIEKLKTDPSMIDLPAYDGFSF